MTTFGHKLFSELFDTQHRCSVIKIALGCVGQTSHRWTKHCGASFSGAKWHAGDKLITSDTDLIRQLWMCMSHLLRCRWWKIPHAFFVVFWPTRQSRTRSTSSLNKQSFCGHSGWTSKVTHVVAFLTRYKGNGPIVLCDARVTDGPLDSSSWSREHRVWSRLRKIMSQPPLSHRLSVHYRCNRALITVSVP